ncbi:MAG: chorismate mutase [Acidobacteria bacterium]|nr:chorismate mutase [Acidobacteriota bacterium]
MTLTRFRKKIDQLDRRLVRMLNQRARAAQQIGRLKRRTRMAIYEPKRERVILDNVRRANRGPLTDRQLADMYRRIIRAMRELQRGVILSSSTQGRRGIGKSRRR